MADKQTLSDDLAYVRATAERSIRVHVPAIYLLWATICLCGFSLVDVAGPQSAWIGIYWLIAAPFGFGITMWLASRAGQRAGVIDPGEANRWKFHFMGFMAAGLLGFAAIAAGQLTWTGFSSHWILLAALTYYLAGLHLEKRLLPISLLMGVGYLCSLFVPEYGFTIAGILVAFSLTVQAFLGSEPDHAAD